MTDPKRETEGLLAGHYADGAGHSNPPETCRCNAPQTDAYDESAGLTCKAHASPLFDADTHPWRCDAREAEETTGPCGPWGGEVDPNPPQVRWVPCGVCGARDGERCDITKHPAVTATPDGLIFSDDPDTGES